MLFLTLLRRASHCYPSTTRRGGSSSSCPLRSGCWSDIVFFSHGGALDNARAREASLHYPSRCDGLHHSQRRQSPAHAYPPPPDVGQEEQGGGALPTDPIRVFCAAALEPRAFPAAHSQRSLRSAKLRGEAQARGFVRCEPALGGAGESCTTRATVTVGAVGLANLDRVDLFLREGCPRRMSAGRGPVQVGRRPQRRRCFRRGPSRPAGRSRRSRTRWRCRCER